MPHKISSLVTLAALGPLAFATSHAALVWDGSGDGVSIFQEANWTRHVGGDPAANTINPGVAILNNSTLTGGEILIASGTGTPSNVGSGQFQVGTNNLTVSNGKIIGGGSTTGADATSMLGSQGSILTLDTGAQLTANGVTGFNRIFVDGATIDLRGTSGIAFNTGSNPFMSILNGSLVDVQFIVASAAPDDLEVVLGGGSSLTFNGSGIPLNTMTLDILDTTSLLQLTNEVFNDGLGGGFEPEHMAKVTFNGAALVFGSDPFAIEAGDNAIATQINAGLGVAIQAIPEPSSLVLGLIGFLGAIRRRR